eukprot:CAMPEP_0194089994 /NCGR_PEP_ID=MMETSP0149-20130528/37000_1 /TAXON_ID=122233 /ORGANISM="Chaetoceros debilis, Strain MM31A-1" /LENGTH=115 /DNA_ID=CAMNT_0038774097 /DNA_START=73 /DNA_END=417 /DNA_ORIENTATION=-
MTGEEQKNSDSIDNENNDAESGNDRPPLNVKKHLNSRDISEASYLSMQEMLDIKVGDIEFVHDEKKARDVLTTIYNKASSNIGSYENDGDGLLGIMGRMLLICTIAAFGTIRIFE